MPWTEITRRQYRREGLRYANNMTNAKPRHLFADGACAGEKLQDALAKLNMWTIEIIKRSDTAKNFEAPIASAVGWVFVAHIRLLRRRITRALTDVDLFESDSKASPPPRRSAPAPARRP